MCAWFQKLTEGLFGNHRSKPVDSPAAGRRRRVTIGLDFGTSTSKCCFREELDGKPFVFVAFAGPDGEGHSPLFDTAVACADRTLIFGPHAKSAAGVVRSFKMCLPCQARKDAGSLQTGQCPRCNSDVPGTFRLAGEALSAEDVCTLHLSVMLSEVLNAIPSAVGGDPSRLRMHVNAAAPLDQLKQFGSVGPYFERVVFYALRIAEAGVPKRHWPIADALAALRAARQQPLPGESESPTAVFPETHAAITGYLLLPESEKGLYGILDVGAGTSDVSFFWLQKDQNDTRAWYYATGTIPRGMDDVDRALAPELKVPADQLRAKRESMGAEWLDRKGAMFDAVSRAISKHLGAVYHDARGVDQRDWAWVDKGVAQFRLFLVGGGAGCTPLVERSAKTPPQGSGWKEAPARLLVPSNASVVAPDGSLLSIRKATFEDARPLLLLAYGLAHARPDVPKFDRDRDGVVVVKTERTQISHEDLYGR